MSAHIYSPDNVLIESWVDETRLHSTFDSVTGELIEAVPYTAEENADADGEAVIATQTANKSTIELNLEEDLATMQAIKDTDNSVINDSPAAYIKDIAVAVRRLIKMTLED